MNQSNGLARRLRRSNALLLQRDRELAFHREAARARGRDRHRRFRHRLFLAQLSGPCHVNHIKIAQDFIHDIQLDSGDVAIVRAAISLGRELGIAVIAEGVETKHQLEMTESSSAAQGAAKPSSL